MVALVISIVFRKPIAKFLSRLAHHITKVSIFDVTFELRPASAAPNFDGFGKKAIRADSADEIDQLLQQVALTEPADYSLIDIGTGNEWLTSRLFLVAAMLPRMRGVQTIVFVEKVAAVEKRFNRVVSADTLRWALAKHQQWLEAAWCLASLEVFGVPDIKDLDPRTVGENPTCILSMSGAWEPANARRVAARYLNYLQAQAGFANAYLLDKHLFERGSLVTSELLNELLPDDSKDQWMYAAIDEPRPRRTRAMLRRTGSFVALLQKNREFHSLINRQSLLEQLATANAEEPEQTA